MEAQEHKYEVVANWVKENISNGRFQRGSKLPSENVLSEQFGLSRQTIRHAIDILEQENLITRMKGSGTYIGEGAKSGRSRRYFNIAVISTYTDSYIFPPILRGIENVLSKNGYMMQIAFTGNEIFREKQILQQLLEKDNIDGLIVEATKSALPNPNLHFYRELMKRRIPILFFNSSYQELGLPRVALDDFSAGRKAVEYLVKAGHKKIGGLFKCDDGQGPLRYAGFVKGMEEAGLKLKSRNIIWTETESTIDMENWMDYLMNRLEDCTALVCYNDEVAYTFLQICQKRGIEIPGQLSVISIDNSNLAVLSDVQITSFPHPLEDLGRKTAENMVKMIDNPYYDGSYLFDSQVIERDSVRFLTEQIAPLSTTGGKAVERE
ncbi:GntR family transcriptional regulator [Lachnospiraceae bacterium 62-35]